ncbi:hypothetical protein OAJ77_08075 [Rhodospirillales bacterium]|nr:hypothetical protein [Rhodospirillales bacterium]
MAESKVERKIAVILANDVVGYGTKIQEERGTDSPDPQRSVVLRYGISSKPSRLGSIWVKGNARFTYKSATGCTKLASSMLPTLMFFTPGRPVPWPNNWEPQLAQNSLTTVLPESAAWEKDFGSPWVITTSSSATKILVAKAEPVTLRQVSQ